MSFNRVILLGNLTRDIELRHVGQTCVGQIGLAVNRRYKDRDGNKQEETTFVDCEAWGKTAEVMAQYLTKGKPVLVEGRLKLDQWDDKEGGKRSKLKVVVESFQFVGGGETGEKGGAKPSKPTGVRIPAQNSVVPYDDDEQIPF